MGHFRVDPAGSHNKLFTGESLIARHPDPSKLYWASSSANSSNFGKGKDVGGYIGEITPPDLSVLSPHHSLMQSPIASPLQGAVDVMTDYLEHGDAAHPNRNYHRIGGMALDNQDRLWVNFARYYHVQGDIAPSLCLMDKNLRRVGLYYRSTNHAGEPSDPNGSLTSLAGTPLGEFGDFLAVVYWMSNSFGPRQGLVKITGAESLSYQPLIYHTPDSKWPEASMKIKCGPGVFVGDRCVFPMRNGIDGWYGAADGTLPTAKHSPPSERNWLPDMHDKSKGYHAPPYGGYLLSVQIEQLAEVMRGDRQPSRCDYELCDITQYLKAVAIDPSGRTQYRCDIGNSLVRWNDCYLLLERGVDTTRTSAILPVIHVFR